MSGLSSDERRGLLLSVGSGRRHRPLSPIEIGRLLRKSISAGSSKEQLAELLHLDSIDMVSRFARLGELQEDVQFVVGWGNTGSTLSFTTASEIARLKSGPDQRQLAAAALRDALTSSEVRQVVQLMLGSGRTLDGAVAQILNARPRIVARHVIAGLIMDSGTSQALEKMTQLERDELFADVIEASFRDQGIQSWRLGSTQFLLSGGDEMKQAFEDIGIDFETVVTKAVGDWIAR